MQRRIEVTHFVSPLNLFGNQSDSKVQVITSEGLYPSAVSFHQAMAVAAGDPKRSDGDPVGWDVWSPPETLKTKDLLSRNREPMTVDCRGSQQFGAFPPRKTG